MVVCGHLKTDSILFNCSYNFYFICKIWSLFSLGIILYLVSYMFLVDYLGITKLLVQFPAQLRLFSGYNLVYIFL